MASISLVTLVFVLFLKSVHCNIWSYIEFKDSVNLTVINTFNCDSKLWCAARCSDSYTLVVVTVQDDLCYCLDPQQSMFGFKDQINLPSVYSRTPELCILKGYQSFPDLGICVKLSTIEANWENAKNHCNQDGGYLININTAEKFSTILNMPEANIGDMIFIGGFAIGLPASYKWTRGDTVDNMFWSSGEPNGFASGERCIAMHQSQGGFLDLPCAWSKHFICEILL